MIQPFVKLIAFELNRFGIAYDTGVFSKYDQQDIDPEHPVIRSKNRSCLFLSIQNDEEPKNITGTFLLTDLHNSKQIIGREPHFSKYAVSWWVGKHPETDFYFIP